MSDPNDRSIQENTFQDRHKPGASQGPARESAEDPRQPQPYATLDSTSRLNATTMILGGIAVVIVLAVLVFG